MEIKKEKKLNEAKEKLPISFLTDFVSRGWDDVGYLKETIKSIGESFSGTKKIEELLQALIDAYLVCIGQLELHLQQKDYLDTDIKEDLKEGIDIHIEGTNVSVTDEDGEEIIAIPVEPEKDANAAAEDAHAEEIPPAEIEMPVVVEPTEDEPAEEPIAADDGEFNTPFEFDAPEADNVRKFEKPDLADFFVDFDDPTGEPVTEKELYGEGEEPIEGEKIDADVEDKE